VFTIAQVSNGQAIVTQALSPLAFKMLFVYRIGYQTKHSQIKVTDLLFTVGRHKLSMTLDLNEADKANNMALLVQHNLCTKIFETEYIFLEMDINSLDTIDADNKINIDIWDVEKLIPP